MFYLPIWFHNDIHSPKMKKPIQLFINYQYKKQVKYLFLNDFFTFAAEKVEKKTRNLLIDSFKIQLNILKIF